MLNKSPTINKLTDSVENHRKVNIYPQAGMSGSGKMDSLGFPSVWDCYDPPVYTTPVIPSLVKSPSLVKHASSRLHDRIRAG